MNETNQPGKAEFLATVAARSSHGLRGDYSRMRDDYTVEQDYSRYSPSHQQAWRRLYARQHQLLPGRACSAFLSALESLDFGDAIPSFDTVNERLHAATRWKLVPVPGLLPDEIFFGHVPMLFDAQIADYLQAYGLGGLKAQQLGGLKYLARLYWYTIEFGLIDDFQKIYFIVDSFGQLFDETAPDFSLLYRALARLPELEP